MYTLSSCSIALQYWIRALSRMALWWTYYKFAMTIVPFGMYQPRYSSASDVACGIPITDRESLVTVIYHGKQGNRGVYLASRLASNARSL